MSALVENHVLSSLVPTDREAIYAHLEHVELPVRKVIEVPHQAISDVYFPLSGTISVIAKEARRRREVEVGVIGREGMTGLSVVLDDGRAVNRAVVQVAGQALRISTEDLRSELDNSRTMLTCFLRYAHSFLLQTAQSALANGVGNLEERLARWILLSMDRLRSDRIPLTHEYLSIMLSVRRAGVTEALKGLKTDGIVDTHRGEIVVLDRAAVEKLANGLYASAEA